jgi:hypothetical protein
MPRTKHPKQHEINPGPQPTQRRPKPVFRFSLSSFIGALVLISSFVDQLRGGTLIETMLMTLVLLCAVLSIAGGRGALVGAVLVAPAVTGEWVAQTECKGMHSRLGSAVDRNICHRRECQS